MKKIILITMLMSAVFAQSDCNENNWKDYYYSDSKDMSDCDLRGANLTGRMLTGANLTRANLTGANLTRVNLVRANLTGANLTGANLTRISLTGSDLTGANLTGADLTAKLAGGANLTGANLTGAILEGVESDNIIGLPQSLPDGWSLVDGTLIEDEEMEGFKRKLSDEIFREINEGKAIKISKWRAWKKKNDPQVSKGKTTFKNLDKNNNGKISSGEFFKFYKRWIQD